MFRIDSHIDNHGVYRAQVLEELSWLDHGFGTRLSSEWPNGSSNATVRQIHSDKVLLAEGAGCLGDGDALISNRPGITLTIRTADCLPILIADPTHRAVAAVHAGWRGTVLGILPKTIEAMTQKFGSRAEELVVVVGPSIGDCCFEVGPEVATLFAPFFPEREDLAGIAKVDLIETTRRQLGRNGGTVGHFGSLGICTVCCSDLLNSFRRDREAAGRMITAVRIRD